MSAPASPPPSLARPRIVSRSGGLAQAPASPEPRSLASVTNELEISGLPSVLQNDQGETVALPPTPPDIEDTTSESQPAPQPIDTQLRPTAGLEPFDIPENVTGVRQLSRRMNPDSNIDRPSDYAVPHRSSNNEVNPDEPQESNALPETTRLSLPIDDGMASLRQRIHDIRDTETSTSEKARRIHQVMTESYYTSRTLYPRPESASDSLHNLDLSQTPRSAQSKQSLDQLSTSPPSPSPAANSGSPYYLTQKDFNQTYYPKPISTTNDDDEILAASGAIPSNDLEDEDEVELGCVHYKRNIKLQCYTCKRWYSCRFCHDEAEDHVLNRRETENMLCMLCNSPQPASQWCKNCGTQAACYFCPTCKLWDNNAEKSIYHCDECGICRIGQGIGKDFFHCKVI